MKTIIAGCRTCINPDILVEALLATPWKVTSVVSGEALGADRLGEKYAIKEGIPLELHPAMWNAQGKAAGMIRNAEMANCSEALIALWDGKSRGTMNMIVLAKNAGLEVHVYLYTEFENIFNHAGVTH